MNIYNLFLYISSFLLTDNYSEKIYKLLTNDKLKLRNCFSLNKKDKKINKFIKIAHKLTTEYFFQMSHYNYIISTSCRSDEQTLIEFKFNKHKENLCRYFCLEYVSKLEIEEKLIDFLKDFYKKKHKIYNLNKETYFKKYIRDNRIKDLICLNYNKKDFILFLIKKFLLSKEFAELKIFLPELNLISYLVSNVDKMPFHKIIHYCLLHFYLKYEYISKLLNCNLFNLKFIPKYLLYIFVELKLNLRCMLYTMLQEVQYEAVNEYKGFIYFLLSEFYTDIYAYENLLKEKKNFLKKDFYFRFSKHFVDSN
ncbi:hypothetical protein TUBRATIS_18130 [Tubulinosema ratisbonensis]|uniref:Uncharacterized protein n=1 Tax=Tubulinosema ratisbonensis TaxID=291195 RepID=A0A437AKV8_9MICR|nr:hypothetical protein TUBRATIS_18130 [Tubulinosema ratisbonensis]